MDGELFSMFNQRLPHVPDRETEGINKPIFVGIQNNILKFAHISLSRKSRN